MRNKTIQSRIWGENRQKKYGFDDMIASEAAEAAAETAAVKAVKVVFSRIAMTICAAPDFSCHGWWCNAMMQRAVMRIEH